MPEGVGGEFLCLAGMPCGGWLGRLGMNSWRAGNGFGLFGGRYLMCRGMRELLQVGFDDLQGAVGFDVGGNVLFEDFAGEYGCGVGRRAVGRCAVNQGDDAVFVVYGDRPCVFAEVELLGEVVFEFAAYFVDEG